MDEEKPVLPSEPSEITPEQREELRQKAAANAKRVQEAWIEREERERREAMETIVDCASRATGKTREELMREAEILPPSEPIREYVPSTEEIARKHMKAAGVPELHVDAVARAVTACDALTSVQKFIASFSRWILVLSGALGTRKTGSACWMLGRIDGGIFVKASDSCISAYYSDKFERLRAARYVVFDDLGTEIRDDRWISRFSSLFDDWYANKAKVIITTNLDAEVFRQTYGERIIDRIRERGEFVIIVGDSVRLQTVFL